MTSLNSLVAKIQNHETEGSPTGYPPAHFVTQGGKPRQEYDHMFQENI